MTKSKASPEMCKTEQPSIASTESEAKNPPAFKKGTKVVLANIGKQNPVLCSGMTGRIVSVPQPGRYSVSFSNLKQEQILVAKNLRAEEKVPREHHECICGKEGILRCTRCNMQWYCSSDCQTGDYKRHRTVCKMLASELSIFDLKAPPTDDGPSVES